MNDPLRQLANLPMSTGRAADLAHVFRNPSQELRRMAESGKVLRLARGVYAAVPLRATARWRPSLEAAAMAWATATHGDRVPILMGLGAARFHHAIPRALGVTVVALPVQHRPLELLGGTVLFVKRDVDSLEARTERSELGEMLVTTPEQTLVDLIARPQLGDMPDEAEAAARALVQIADLRAVETLARAQRKLRPVHTFLKEI